MRKGFTLIEMVVVIAVIAILVMLAGMSIGGNIKEAKLAQIKNDVAVATDWLDTKIIYEENVFEILVDKLALNQDKLKGKIYDIRGQVDLDTSIGGQLYKIKPNIGSKLDGYFIGNTDGQVYYVNNKNVKLKEVEKEKDDDDSMFVYSYDDEKMEAVLRGFRKGKFSANIVVPSKVKRKGKIYDVVSVGAYSFRGKGLNSVTLPNSIRSILDGAFYSNNITNVNLGTGPKTISNWVFYNNKLSEIDLKSVTDIGDYAFYKAGLNKEITIPDTIKEIKTGAFRSNPIRKINMNNNVRIIRNDAFYESNIANLVIPNSIIEIGDWAFYKSGINEIKLSNSLSKIGNYTFYKNNIENLSIPDSVKEMGQRAFSDNIINNLKLSNSLKEISKSTFYGNNIVELNIPDSIINIKEYAFYRNNISQLEISKNVKNIGEFAFVDNDNLINVKINNIPNNINIDKLSFSGRVKFSYEQ